MIQTPSGTLFAIVSEAYQQEQRPVATVIIERELYPDPRA